MNDSNIPTESNMDSSVVQTSQPTITVSELANAANFIDLAVQRGAYKITEIRQVGELYEKLATFVKYVAEQQSKEKAPE